MWHTSWLQAWLTLLKVAAVFFFLFPFECLCVQHTIPQNTQLISFFLFFFEHPLCHTGAFTLLLCMILNFCFFRVTRIFVCWTNKKTPDSNLWGATNERKIKWLTLALKAHRSLWRFEKQCSVFKVWCKQEFVWKHWLSQIIVCSLSPPQFFSIILSWSKHSLPTTKPAWLKIGWVYPWGLWSRLGSDRRDLRER